MNQPELFNGQEMRSLGESSGQAPSLRLDNRKYIGSKVRLLEFIQKVVLSRVPSIGTFFDPFSGTGVVAYGFRSHSESVVANDLLYSNYVTNRAFLCATPENYSEQRIAKHLAMLNSSPPTKGYACENYGGTYFSVENAGRIDTIREAIEALFQSGDCTLQEKCVLLTSLLFAADKVANTVGQYDAYLKHLGRDAYDAEGRHVIDSNVYKRIHLLLPLIECDTRHRVYNENANHLAPDIAADVTYLDPPYNGRQYIDNYHVLENIARWEKPPLYGKTAKFEREALKSDYSRASKALPTLSDLLERLRTNHVFLSYNNEGIISSEDLLELLRRHGKTEVVETSYSVFGNGAGKSVKRPVQERLYYCRVTR